jgi:hypothetical protein
MDRNFQAEQLQGDEWYIADPELDLSATVSGKQVADEIVKLLNKEEAEVCPACCGIGVYCYDDESEDQGILTITTHSCFDWTCPHCNTSLAPIDSPILAEVYTHIPWDEMNADDADDA